MVSPYFNLNKYSIDLYIIILENCFILNINPYQYPHSNSYSHAGYFKVSIVFDCFVRLSVDC